MKLRVVARQVRDYSIPCSTPIVGKHGCIHAAELRVLSPYIPLSHSLLYLCLCFDSRYDRGYFVPLVGENGPDRFRSA